MEESGGGRDFSNNSERPQQASSSRQTEAGNFECNICLDLAQDPVVTLCGHLFCWPCLYRWLHGHSTCQECPVCKALIEEEKIVPLYGRGNPSSTDPRKKSVPHRPSGQRPETAHPPPNTGVNFNNSFSNFMGGLGGGGGGVPVAATRFGNVTFSAGFGFFPSLFGFQFHGFPEGAGGLGFGGANFPFGVPMGGWHHGHHNPGVRRPPPTVEQQQEAKLSKLLMALGILNKRYMLNSGEVTETRYAGLCINVCIDPHPPLGTDVVGGDVIVASPYYA